MVRRTWVAFVVGAIVAAPVPLLAAPPAEPGPRDVDLDRARKVDRLGQRLPDGAVARLGRGNKPGVGTGSRGLTFSPDGALLAYVANDGATSIWDIKAETELHRFAPDPVHFPPTFTSRVFTTDGKLLIGEGGVVWDVATGKPADGFGPAPKVGDWPLKLPTPSPDGKTVLFLTLPGDEVGEVVVYEVATRKEIRRFGKGTRVSGPLVFSPDGRTLAAAKAPAPSVRLLGSGPPRRRTPVEGDGSGVLLWDPGTGEKRAEWGPGVARYAPRSPVGFSGDAKTLYLLEGEQVAAWDAATGKPSGQAFAPGAREAVLLPDRGTLAVVERKALALWSVVDRKQLGRVERPAASLASPVLAASPGGRWLATGSSDGPVIVWDVAALRAKP
jgi:WD40 repeat protein